MVKISVIVPVNNVQDYLMETLESILNQTMIDDLEVIMVDDGSTDNSGSIIDSYANRYDNFHAYHKKNEGQGIARNYGLKFARGEYIHFMDADDYLPPKAYENLYNFNSDNDFIVGNVLRFGEYNIWENNLFKNAFKDFTGDVKSFVLREFPNILWDTIVCNKLYKREFIERYNLHFINQNIYYEDLLFSLQSYVLADSIGFSRGIFYFWRFRYDKSSITQKQDDIKNFSDRLIILKLYESIMNHYNLPDYIKRIVYDKWLKHDLRTSLKKIGNYSGKYYSRLLDETIEILEIIPDDLKDDLNIYLKILYKMVENRDIVSLLEFAHMEEDIKTDINVLSHISEKYFDSSDLNCNDYGGEFEVSISNIFYDEETLYLEFAENVEFVPKNCPHEIIAYLVYKNNEMLLDIRNNQIIIPLNAIRDLSHLKIKVAYMSNSFNMVSLLKSYDRKVIKTQNYDIDFGIGINNTAYFDVITRNNNQVIIKNISLDNGKFIFECESLDKVNDLGLTRFVTCNRSYYPARYSQNTNKFVFSIPINDLNTSIIKKWELNCPDSFNSIKLLKKFKFLFKDSAIIFKNKRNKIFVYRKNIINSQIDDLMIENKKLVKENADLKNTINRFKSRKAVSYVDRLKNILKIKR